jgi:DNA polymerase III delta prime subunit
MKREYNILGQTMKLTDSEFNKIASVSYNDMRRAKDTHEEAIERIAEILKVSKERIKIALE